MSVAVEVTRRVLDEEIERHGSWWDTENCWVVVIGTHKTRGPIDEVTPTLAITSRRTGITVERLKEMFRVQGELFGEGRYLTTSREHRDRRIEDGTLRVIDRKAERERNLFHYCEPQAT